MQVFISRSDIDSFTNEVNQYLNNGFRIVSGTSMVLPQPYSEHSNRNFFYCVVVEKIVEIPAQYYTQPWLV